MLLQKHMFVPHTPNKTYEQKFEVLKTNAFNRTYEQVQTVQTDSNSPCHQIRREDAAHLLPLELDHLQLADALP